MSDRELLELAAKAAGLALGAWQEAQTLPFHPRKAGYGCPEGTWNSLTDDGDALRLAVSLRLDSIQYKDGVEAGGRRQVGCDEFYGSDPYAATRRAITRAAAALAKDTP